MRTMQDRVWERRRRMGIRDNDNEDPGLNARIERELAREDEEAVMRQHSDGRRSETTGY